MFNNKKKNKFILITFGTDLVYIYLIATLQEKLYTRTLILIQSQFLSFTKK